MQINGFTIDFTSNRASINFAETPEKIFDGATGVVQVPIKTQSGENIDDARRRSRMRAADALELVVKALREGEISEVELRNQ